RQAPREKGPVQEGHGPAGFSGRVEADAEHGSLEASARVIAGDRCEGAAGCIDGRQTSQTCGGKRTLDDPAGARRSERAEWPAQVAERQGRRAARAGSESPAGTGPADAQEEEDTKTDGGHDTAKR